MATCPYIRTAYTYTVKASTSNLHYYIVIWKEQKKTDSLLHTYYFIITLMPKQS